MIESAAYIISSIDFFAILILYTYKLTIYFKQTFFDNELKIAKMIRKI